MNSSKEYNKNKINYSIVVDSPKLWNPIGLSRIQHRIIFLILEVDRRQGSLCTSHFFLFQLKWVRMMKGWEEQTPPVCQQEPRAGTGIATIFSTISTSIDTEETSNSTTDPSPSSITISSS
jgi:hypothetical protein